MTRGNWARVIVAVCILVAVGIAARCSSDTATTRSRGDRANLSAAFGVP